MSALALVSEPNPAYDLTFLGGYGESEEDIEVRFPDGATINANSDYTFLMINGVLIPNAEIVTQNNRTLVPVRIISETLGAEVGWEGSTQRVTITKGSKLITMTINSTDVQVNRDRIALDVPATLINSRTYVPLRFIAEALDAEVGYSTAAPFHYYPVVWVDSVDLLKERHISGEDSLQNTKALYFRALKAYLSENDYLDTYSYQYANGDIEGKKLLGELSRFWVLGNETEWSDEGFWSNALVDKYTGKVFYFRECSDMFYIEEFIDSPEGLVGAMQIIYFSC
jgi:hypothetical protein